MKIKVSEMQSSAQGIPDGFLDFDHSVGKTQRFSFDPFELTDYVSDDPGSHVMTTVLSDPRDDPEAVELASAPNLDWKLCGAGDFNSDGNVDLVWIADIARVFYQSIITV